MYILWRQLILENEWFKFYLDWYVRKKAERVAYSKWQNKCNGKRSRNIRTSRHIMRNKEKLCCKKSKYSKSISVCKLFLHWKLCQGKKVVYVKIGIWSHNLILFIYSRNLSHFGTGMVVEALHLSLASIPHDCYLKKSHINLQISKVFFFKRSLS